MTERPLTGAVQEFAFDERVVMAAETVPPAAVEDDCIDCGAGPEAFSVVGDERLQVVRSDWGRRHAELDFRSAGGGTSGVVVAGPAWPVSLEG